MAANERLAEYIRKRDFGTRARTGKKEFVIGGYTPSDKRGRPGR